MALGETRQVFQTNTDCATSGALERGGIASFVPWAEGLCYYAPSGAMSGVTIRPHGLVLEDIEDLNHFKQPEFRNRNVSQIGSAIGVATEGEFLTDFVETTFVPDGGGGVLTNTYSPGDVLFLGDAGQVTNLQIIGSRPRIGYALSSVDTNGFLKIKLQIH